MSKVNKSKIRRDIVAELVKEFKDSGVEFSCLASVLGVVRNTALLRAHELLAQGINLSKSEYSFSWVGNMADMFSMDTAKVIYGEYLSQNVD